MLGPAYHRPLPDPDYGAGARFRCSTCGSYPAADVNLRGHRGFVVWMEFIKETGPFCRSCGLSEYRDMTSATLLKGWWSPFSLVLAPLTLLVNYDAYARIRALDEPVPGSPRAPMAIGKPVHRRPAIAMLLVPIVTLVAIIVWVGRSDSDGEAGNDTAKVRAGHCVVTSGQLLDPTLRITDCVPQAEPVFRVVDRIEDPTAILTDCPEPTTDTFMAMGSDGVLDYLICLAPLGTPTGASA
ncbi:LppU/SCO3897 family protein [Yinghuangia sp. YIM S09857]|uniref:LppU/SCO3897 family protein n=1 Tax=Yinghuangia sp. YIM S09857 TaxID=3436929 RepID=UPI003F535354